MYNKCKCFNGKHTDEDFTTEENAGGGGGLKHEENGIFSFF